MQGIQKVILYASLTWIGVSSENFPGAYLFSDFQQRVALNVFFWVDEEKKKAQEYVSIQ
jgi:hypothetical protein